MSEVNVSRPSEKEPAGNILQIIKSWKAISTNSLALTFNKGPLNASRVG